MKEAIIFIASVLGKNARADMVLIAVALIYFLDKITEKLSRIVQIMEVAVK